MRGSRLLEKVWGGHHAEYFNFSKFLNSHLEVVENRPLDPLVRKPLGHSLSWGKRESYGLLDLLSTPIKLHIRCNQAPISVKTRCFVTLKCMLNCLTFSGKMLQLQNLAIFFIKLPQTIYLQTVTIIYWRVSASQTKSPFVCLII